MIYRFFADLVMVAHFAFIMFAVFGGLAALRWRGALWLHVPAVVWSILILLLGWACPLTPLENWLRQKGGETGYETSFIEQYLMPIIYPGVLSIEIAITLAALLFGANLCVYVWIFRNR